MLTGSGKVASQHLRVTYCRQHPVLRLNVKINRHKRQLLQTWTLQPQFSPKPEPFSYATPGLLTHRNFSGVVSTGPFAYTVVGHNGTSLVERIQELTAKPFSF